MTDWLLKEHRRFARMIMPWLLAISGLLSIWAGLLSPYRTMPDERHHISYASYLYKHPLPFPPRLDMIYTGLQRDYNHIKHPPLYYYYLAGVLAFSDYDADFTEQGRDLDLYGNHQTARTTVPLLRLASWVLMALGLLGTFKLLRYLDRRDLLDPWLGLLFVLMTHFIPGWLFIGGAINNDVMVMALWPWLALTLMRYQQEQRPGDFWLGAVLIGLLVLTKSTVWLLALVTTLTFLGLARRSRQWRQLLSQNKLAMAAGMCVAILVATFLVSNQVRYGHLQPSYLQVHQLDLRDSKFWTLPKDAAEPHITWSYTFERANYYLMRGWTGILSHRDLIEKPHLDHLGLWARLAWLLLTLAFALALGKKLGRSWLLAIALILPLQYALMLIYNHAIYPKYLVHAMEGRYLIGSLHLSLLAILIGVYQCRDSSRSAQVARGLTLIASMIWLIVFFDPLLFNRQTSAYVRDSQIVKTVSQHIQKDGFTNAKVAYGKPRKAMEQLRTHNLPAHYQLADGQQLTLNLTGDKLLKIYAEGLLSETPTALKVTSEAANSPDLVTVEEDATIQSIPVSGKTTIEAQGNIRIYAIWQKARAR